MGLGTATKISRDRQVGTPVLHTGDVVFFRFGEFVDLTDVGVYELLHFFKPVAFVVFRNLFVPSTSLLRRSFESWRMFRTAVVVFCPPPKDI